MIYSTANGNIKKSHILPLIVLIDFSEISGLNLQNFNDNANNNICL